MGDKTEAKYAAEAYELFRLFDRIGRTFYGLLLAEIGWLFLLILVSKIVGTQGGQSTLAFPVLNLNGHHPCIEFRDIKLSVVTTVGMIFIAIGWICYSRLYNYITAPIVQLFVLSAKWLLIAFSLLIAIINFLLLPITWPLERFLLKLRMKKERDELIEILHKKNPRADAEAEYKNFEEKIKKECGDDILERRAFDKIVLTRYFLVKIVWAACLAILRNIQSSGRIGVAPLVTYSYSEDYQAAKTQLQVFAVARGKIRSVLKNISAVNHIHFYDLPGHLKIMNHQEAAIAARFFGLDVLLRGSYLYEPSKSNNIWMNIHSTLRSHDSKNREDDRSISIGLQFQWGIFPERIEINTPAIVFSEKDYRQVYLVLLIATIQALNGRWRTRIDSISKSKRYQLYSICSHLDAVWDQLYQASDDIVNQLALDLVTDALIDFPDAPIENEIFPSVNAQLVELAGKWIGCQFAQYRTHKYSLLDRVDQKKIAEQLYTVATKCSILCPEQSEHFYRLGAIDCLLENAASALINFKKAGEVDSQIIKFRNISIFIAEMELKNNKGSFDDKLSLIRFATHAACVINNGDNFQIEKIKDIINKSDNISMLKKYGVRPMPTSIIVIEKMLENIHQQ